MGMLAVLKQDRCGEVVGNAETPVSEFIGRFFDVALRFGRLGPGGE